MAWREIFEFFGAHLFLHQKPSSPRSARTTAAGRVGRTGMLLGLILCFGTAGANLAWSQAREPIPEPPPRPLLVDGHPSAVRNTLGWSLDDQAKQATRVVVVPEQAEKKIAFAQVSETVNQLEQHFAENGAYPEELPGEQPAGVSYRVDGEDFTLEASSFRYDSRRGWSESPAKSAVLKVHPFRFSASGWGPWQQTEVAIEGDSELNNSLVKAGAKSEFPLRFLATDEGLPEFLSSLKGRYRHFEVSFDPYQHRLEARAARASERWGAAPALPELPARAMAVAGDSEFLARLGLEQSLAAGEVLVCDEILDSECYLRAQDFLSFAERFPAANAQLADATESTPSTRQVRAVGHFVWQDSQGNRWLWRWQAGVESEADWLTAAAEPYNPEKVKVPTESCYYQGDGESHPSIITSSRSEVAHY